MVCNGPEKREIQYLLKKNRPYWIKLNNGEFRNNVFTSKADHPKMQYNRNAYYNISRIKKELGIHS